MAHIIFKASKSPKQAAVLANSNAQPIVIDFTKGQRPFFTQKTLLIAFGIVLSFFAATLIALFVFVQQMNAELREAIKKNPVQIVAEPVAPESAFPATTLTPLPSKALIIGKDFQQSKDDTKGRVKVDIIPMLERLPLYDNQKRHRASSDIGIEVETSETAATSSSLQHNADEAVEAGDMGKAVSLYARAVKLNPKDETLRSNAVSLLLQQARSFDEAGNAPAAIDSYKQALNLWKGDSATASAIRTRIAYLQDKISE